MAPAHTVTWSHYVSAAKNAKQEDRGPEVSRFLYSQENTEEVRTEYCLQQKRAEGDRRWTPALGTGRL